MSDNQTADCENGPTVKPRRVDGPHTVGPLKSEHSPALVLELAGVGASSAGAYQSESLDFSGASAPALDDLLQLDESLEAREEQLETQAGQLNCKTNCESWNIASPCRTPGPRSWTTNFAALAFGSPRSRRS